MYVNMASFMPSLAMFLPFCFALVQSAAYTDGRWVVVFRSNGQERLNKGGVNCFVYDLRRDTLPHVEAADVHKTNSSTMSLLVDECGGRKQTRHLLHRHQNWRVKRSLFNFLWGMYPGTKWCGKGNVAKDRFDLGPAWKADSCCREHDTACGIYLLPGETKYGATNREMYTINDCRCDGLFQDCLQRADTPASNNIGDLFFNIIRVKCLKVAPTAGGTVNASIKGTIQQPQPYQGSAITDLLSGVVKLGSGTTGLLDLQ